MGASLAAWLEQLDEGECARMRLGVRTGEIPLLLDQPAGRQVVYDPFDWLLEATQNS